MVCNVILNLHLFGGTTQKICIIFSVRDAGRFFLFLTQMKLCCVSQLFAFHLFDQTQKCIFIALIYVFVCNRTWNLYNCILCIHQGTHESILNKCSKLSESCRSAIGSPKEMPVKSCQCWHLTHSNIYNTIIFKVSLPVSVDQNFRERCLYYCCLDGGCDSEIWGEGKWSLPLQRKTPDGLTSPCMVVFATTDFKFNIIQSAL